MKKKKWMEGKGAYALFLKKSITVSTGESQTDVVVEWAKTSWEITLGGRGYCKKRHSYIRWQ